MKNFIWFLVVAILATVSSIVVAQCDDCGSRSVVVPPASASCGGGYSVVYDAVPKTETIKTKRWDVVWEDVQKTRTVKKIITVPETRTVTVARPITVYQDVTRYKSQVQCEPVIRKQVCCDPCTGLQYEKECTEYVRKVECVPYTCSVPFTRYVDEEREVTLNVQKVIDVQEPYTCKVAHFECIEEEKEVTVNDYVARVVPQPLPPKPCPPPPVCPPVSVCEPACPPCPPAINLWDCPPRGGCSSSPGFDRGIPGCN